jgi:hypothetical protein
MEYKWAKFLSARHSFTNQQQWISLKSESKLAESRFFVDKWSTNGPNICQLVTPSQINKNGSAINLDQKWPQSRFVVDKWRKNGPNFCRLVTPSQINNNG